MSFNGEDVIMIIASLGGGLLCGLPLIAFALVAFYAGRKHTQNAEQINNAIPAKISTLKVNQVVRLEGVITEVPNKIDGPAESPLALVRFQVIAPSSDDDGAGAGGDKIHGVPFKIQDETGSVWVDPQRLDKISLGEGIPPANRGIAEAAVIQTGLDPVVLDSGGRMRLWELRGGQRVTVVGTVASYEGGLVVMKVKNNPLIVTSLLGSNVQVETQKQVKTAWVYTAVLGIPGVLFLCCGVAAAGVGLFRLLQQ
jgi:hypothetical protein